MLTFSDIVAMGKGELATIEAFKELQSMINSGEIWKHDSRYNKIVFGLIEEGRVMLGPHSRIDYRGQFVPARGLVSGKGSYNFVAEKFGEAYAKELDEVA
jgi:hypothetical protein